MRARLQITGGSSAGRSIEIKLPQFVIGRATGCHLRLNSDAISRQHCAFLVNEKEVVLKDLGSRNGTFLNGDQLKEPTILKTGDRLQLGPLKFEVVVTRDDGTVVPAPGAEPAPAAKKPVKDRPSDSGVISDWLLDDDDEEGLSTRITDPETRQFKLDESEMMQAPEPDPKEEKKRKEKEAKAKKKKQPMKLPQSATQPDSDNSRDAAADTLKKLYNRGLS